MFELLRKIFGISPSTNYGELVKQGSIILDVRTRGEYNSGNIKGSINISVDQLKNNLHRIPDKQTPIITCCASGIRSASARRLLKSMGYEHVYNGGSWTGLLEQIK